MNVSVSDAKARLTDLVRRAEEGHEIVLTRHGQPAVRLVPVKRAMKSKSVQALLQQWRAEGIETTPGPCAARSADFLYGDDGMPG